METDIIFCVDLVFWKELKKCFLYFLSKNPFFRDAGHSVHSSVLVVKMNCPMHIIKEISTFDNKFATEAVLEKCIQTVHVLLVETECTQFLWQLFNVAY